MADQVKVSIDTRAGRASLVYGRLFVGGVYDLQVETDGQADTTRLVRIYRFDVARRLKWALAEAKGGGQLFLDSEDFRKAFRTVAPSRALPCEFIVYDDDAIVAQGNVVVEWSPTLTTVDGKPVDVQGPPGPKGDKGEQGPKGDDGKSAYQGAVEQGYQGTEKEFYASLCSLNDLVEAAATSARAAATSAETAAAETLVGAQQLTKAVKAKDDAEAAAKRAEDAAAGTSSAAEEAKAAKEAAEEAKAAAEKVGDFSGHLDDHNNPHRVTAEQVPCGDGTSALAVLDGADNWGTAWGFDLDLRSLNPDAWEGRADGTVAQVTTVGLQVSGSTGKNVSPKLELTGSDGKVWTSANTASWQGSGGAVDYTFDPPAELPNGVLAARFVTEAGEAGNVPLRISKVSTTETPEGCDVWTAEGGTSKRADFAPRVRATTYTLPPQSVEEALADIRAMADGALKSDGGTVDGILRMKNPKVAADDNPEHDIAIVPNADGAGLQVQFPGGATAMIRMKTGTLATVQEVNEAIEAIELTPGPQGPQGEKGDKGDPGDDATVAIDTTMPSSPADDHVPSTQLLNEELAKKLSLAGGTVTGNVRFEGDDNYMEALRFGGSALDAGLKTRGICGTTADGNTKSGLFLNYDGAEVSTEDYFAENNGEGRGVYVCGGKNTQTKAAQVLRKMDGDTFYAPKDQTYSKSDVDGKLDEKLSLSGGTLTGTLTVNATVTATNFKIPQGDASHAGEVISIKNGPTMAGAVGLVYRRPQQANFKPVFLGVSGGDTDSRIHLGDGSVSTAETGLSTVFGIYTPDDRTWARHDLWFTDKLGDAQGTRSWWGLVQDGDELRIVKDKGTPTAYATKAYVDGLVGDIQAALAAI